MKRILSALMIGVMTVVSGIAVKTGLKRVAPALVSETAETGARQMARQAAKKAGQAAKSTKVQKGATATVGSGAAAATATQIHDTGDDDGIVSEAEAHEPTQGGTAGDNQDSEKRVYRRDLGDPSRL